jgi:hypothetical protein
MKKLVLAALTCALLIPAQASARIDALDPAGPGSPLTAAQAIANDPLTVTGASLPEYAFGGSGPPSPIGAGDKVQDPEPKVLVGYPTHGDTYAILSSGSINTIASTLTNTAGNTTTEFVDQFPDIPTIARGPNANDYTVLKVDVSVPAGTNCMSLDYRFLSEEFPEFVGSTFNDAFIAEIDTTSWSAGAGGVITRPNDFAVSPAGNPISINGVGDTAVSASEAAGTYFDAATGLITTKTPITPGAHSIYLSILDASDKRYDSAVFLDDLRFITESAATCKPPTGQQIAPPPPGTPPPPSNKFDPGSSVAFGKTGTSATLTVNVPGPGTLTAGSAVVGAAAARLARVEAAASATKGKAKGKKCKKPKGKKKCKKPKPKVKKPLLKTTTITVTKAGPVQITVRLTKTGAAILAKRRKLTVPVTLTFTPTGGVPASQVRKVTFKAPKKPKCAKGKAKGKKAADSKAKKCKKPAKGKKS